MFDFSKSFRSLPLLLGIVLGGPACAVEIDSGGAGQALIIPLWTTAAGHASPLSVSALLDVPNSPDRPSVARLRVLDANGVALLVGNLHFRNAQDTWTAALVTDGSGASRLASNDDTCLLVEQDGSVVPFGSPLPLDAVHGSIELVAMGDVAEPALHELTAAGDCAGLAERWNTGAWAAAPEAGLLPPETQIRGSVWIIQGERGTLYPMPGVALDGFSDIVQHSPPGAPNPTLVDAHDAGSASGATASRVCYDGRCLEDSWNRPIDAVAAALMVHSLRGSYSIEPSLGGKSELVLAYPLRHYYETLDGIDSPLATTPLAMGVADRSGEPHVLAVCPSVPHRSEFCSETYLVAQHSESVVLVSFIPQIVEGAPPESALLGLPRSPLLPASLLFPPLPFSGSFVAVHDRRGAAVLESNGGRRYYGAPAVAIVMQQVENGNLTSGDGVTQRANYGEASAAVRRLWPASYE